MYFKIRERSFSEKGLPHAADALCLRLPKGNLCLTAATGAGSSEELT